MFPGQIRSQPHTALSGGPGSEESSRGLSWLCINARLLSGYSLRSPGSCSDVSSSLSPFYAHFSLYISFFFCLLGIAYKSRKKMCFLLFLFCRRNVGLTGFFQIFLEGWKALKRITLGTPLQNKLFYDSVYTIQWLQK